jgi:hypothetical protein
VGPHPTAGVPRPLRARRCDARRRKPRFPPLAQIPSSWAGYDAHGSGLVDAGDRGQTVPGPREGAVTQQRIEKTREESRAPRLDQAEARLIPTFKFPQCPGWFTASPVRVLTNPRSGLQGCASRLPTAVSRQIARSTTSDGSLTDHSPELTYQRGSCIQLNSRDADRSGVPRD